MPPVILNSRLSPSTSSADKLIEPLPSSSKLTSDTVASTGASFTASMVKLIDATSDKEPSDTLNVKLSSPL